MLSREIEGLAELLLPHRRSGLLLEPDVVASLVAIFRALALQADAMERIIVPPALRGAAPILPPNVVRLKPRKAPR